MSAAVLVFRKPKPHRGQRVPAVARKIARLAKKKLDTARMLERPIDDLLAETDLNGGA